jgi:hypothetical protein
MPPPPPRGALNPPPPRPKLLGAAELRNPPPPPPNDDRADGAERLIVAPEDEPEYALYRGALGADHVLVAAVPAPRQEPCPAGTAARYDDEGLVVIERGAAEAVVARCGMAAVPADGLLLARDDADRDEPADGIGREKALLAGARDAAEAVAARSGVAAVPADGLPVAKDDACREEPADGTGRDSAVLAGACDVPLTLADGVGRADSAAGARRALCAPTAFRLVLALAGPKESLKRLASACQGRAEAVWVAPAPRSPMVLRGGGVARPACCAPV